MTCCAVSHSDFLNIFLLSGLCTLRSWEETAAGLAFCPVSSPLKNRSLRKALTGGENAPRLLPVSQMEMAAGSTPLSYGFRKNHSPSLALIDLCDKISSAFDRREHAIGVFLDLTRLIMSSFLTNWSIMGSVVWH